MRRRASRSLRQRIGPQLDVGLAGTQVGGCRVGEMAQQGLLGERPGPHVVGLSRGCPLDPGDHESAGNLIAGQVLPAVLQLLAMISP